MTEVCHGYTLQQIDRMARSACLADRSMASDVDTRYNVAWSAIAERLCSSEEPPRWEDLVRTGWQAIYREVREMRHTFGQSRHDPNAEVGSATRFQQYWFVPAPEPEFGLIERLAVAQIMRTISPVYRDAVVALAATEDYRRAAEMLGIQYKALIGRLSTARKAFRLLWFAPDPAPPIRGTDRRVGTYDKPTRTHCLRGHEMAGDNVRLEKNGKRRVCRACERIRGAQKRRTDPLRHDVAASMGEEVSP